MEVSRVLQGYHGSPFDMYVPFSLILPLFHGLSGVVPSYGGDCNAD